MAGGKPTAAMVLSIIGGLFILLGGALYLAIAGFLEGLIVLGGETLDIDPVLWIQVLGAIGIVIGIVIMVGGVMMYSRPASSTIWGVIILVLSLVSIIAAGGFFIGLILGLVGGILGIVFKPAPAVPTSDTSQVQPPPPSQ
ncbi:MAG: DUF6114 domain-containing protein [Thermoplasmata archaeon]